MVIRGLAVAHKMPSHSGYLEQHSNDSYLEGMIASNQFPNVQCETLRTIFMLTMISAHTSFPMAEVTHHSVEDTVA